MKNPILRKIFGLAGTQPPLDPSRFGDPLALKIEWTPATRGGANFRTHRLVQTDFSRVEFRASAGAKIFYAIFGLVGIGFAAAFLFGFLSSGETDNEALLPVIIGILFGFAGALLLISGTTPIVFDKGVGYFWRGRKSPQEVSDIAAIKKCAPLDQIHAIQLVSEWVHSSKSSYYSYELNLVLEDARRITVIDHGNLRWIREDAKKLSEFLGKTVWDAIDRTT